MTTTTRILVVDDEDRIRETIARLLKAKGFSVTTACDGPVALDRLAEAEFDVVLLDLKMPGMSGQETFEEIKRRGHDVETVCLTGHAAMNEALRLLQCGMHDYLLKPASVEDILEAVRRAMEMKRLRHGTIDINRTVKGTAFD